jgi:hypothetical protein
VVLAAVTDLDVQGVRLGMRRDEVVVGLAQVVEQVGELAGLAVRGRVVHAAPGQRGDRGGHRESELDVVSRVVPAARQVHARRFAVVQGGVVAPGDPVPVR